MTRHDVVVVGGGVAGLSAAIFTARHGLDTLVIDRGGRRLSGSRTESRDASGSLLRRNAHLENFPGFPAGVNARRLLDLLGEQADRAGCRRVEAAVTRVERADDGFAVGTAADDRHSTTCVVAATKNEVGYLAVDGVDVVDRGKAFVDTDERGRTGVDGLYAAGRLAGKPHQAAVCAGHGAEVGVTVLEDDDRPFYHDWVAPEGYFADRDRPLPPGCEEIDEAERREREAASLAAMRERFAEPHPGDQVTHPSLED